MTEARKAAGTAMSRGGSAEVKALEEKILDLNSEYDKLNDEWTNKLAAQQHEFQREKHALLQDANARLQAAREDAEAKNATIVAELDKVRRAFNGDPLGWAAAVDDQGKTYYVNSETGESDYDKPRILEVAELVQNMDALDEGRKKQDRAIKKGKDAELRARKLEVSLNSVRAEAAALRKTKKNWEACGAVVMSLCTSITKAMDDIDLRVQKVEERAPVLKQSSTMISAITVKVNVLTNKLHDQDATLKRLNKEAGLALADMQAIQERADGLGARFAQLVEERVDEVKLPLEDELATAYAGRQEEKALRESDRRYLADLWPEGCLVPSMLRPFRTVSLKEREAQTTKMEETEVERDLVEVIRAGVAAAAKVILKRLKWETKNDDYGRVYYTNWETGEAAYEPPPEMGYRPPLGRNELGQKVDPRLQALREWEKEVDGWGKPYWQNVRSGEVVAIEPKGWSEAMGLGEDEFDAWEGPNQSEIAKDVAVDAARVVITWLKKAEEAEANRSRASELLGVDSGGEGEGTQETSGEEDEEDSEEFVYDIQAVEELAMGDDGWRYQPESNDIVEEVAGKEKTVPASDFVGPGAKEGELQQQGGEAGVAELKKAISKLAGREDRLQERLSMVRSQLEELAHDLIVAKKREEEDSHSFSIGHDQVEGTLFNKQEPNSTTGSLRADREEGEHHQPPTESVSPTNVNSGDIKNKAVIKRPTTTPPQTKSEVMEKELNDETEPQSAGDAAAETGTKLRVEPVQDTKSPGALNVGLADPFRFSLKANDGILPHSLAQEIAARAFPLAEGVTCEAFHALAAEAVWAGFNGTNRVEKPHESVWHARGGDRWGTAAFFAEKIVEREDEAIPGLPQTVAVLLEQGDEANKGSDHNYPLSGRAARHAVARRVRLAAISSRRGFLKHATDVAAQEARHHMLAVAKRVMAAPLIDEKYVTSDTLKGKRQICNSNVTEDTTLGLGMDDTMSVQEYKRSMVFEERAGNYNGEEQVKRSPVMLEFGPETPGNALRVSSKAQQLPFLDGWDDPEVCEQRYAEQVARRKEVLQSIAARDRSALDRPQGYRTNKLGNKESLPTGFEDAAELLRYEAVLLERVLHQTLLEVNKKQKKLEANQANATVRWAKLVWEEDRALKRLMIEVSQKQTGLPKLSMEIRGLRVPLIQPQPPPSPTLDPNAMRPPSLNPGGAKMSEKEVADFAQSIRNGKCDRGEALALPEGKTLSSKHLDEVSTAVRERRVEVASLLEDEMTKYKEALDMYEYKHREWERLEVERKERLSICCHQSRLDNLRLDTLSSLKKYLTDHLELLNVEAAADKSIANQSQEARRRFEATLAKQLAEEARAHEWMLKLQVELSDALVDREAFERMPDAALNRLDVLHWEKKRADKMVECRRRVAELRESLVEEGRRRQLLYKERRWTTTSELRRVRAEQVAVNEKEGMVRLWLQVSGATLDSFASTLEARKKEAEEDKEGIETEGSTSPGEMYSKNRSWVNKEFKKAEADMKGWTDKLAEMVQIRGLARQRETTVGELVMGAARGAPPPPHPDQWMPRAERERHEDEVRLLLERHHRELRAEQELVEAARAEVRGADRQACILKAKLEAIQEWRHHETFVLRNAGRDAVENLKALLRKQRQDSAVRIDSLEQALADLRKEYNEVRAELTARIETLNRGRSNSEAWMKALKHEMATERVKREIAEERLWTRTEEWKVLSEKLRTELRSERMHGMRLELWIATLHDGIRRHEAYKEQIRRERQTEREKFEKHLQEHRHLVWRNRTAVRLLGTSVDDLFLFFAQRIANLAGSRRLHNDKLRANGAVGILAAICRGPRKVLRRLGARALGALGWDGYVEARVLAWDIYRKWDLWVESCCPAEEERLRLRGRTFEDPEQFSHTDETTLPLPPSKSETDNPPSVLDGVMIAKPRRNLSEEEAESVTDDIEASVISARTATEQDTMGTISESYQVPKCGVKGKNMAQRDVVQRKNNNDEGRNDAIGQTAPRMERGVQEIYLDQNEGTTDDESEFRVDAAMSAKAVVRARRQWALRRARRSEGPNEANQLELGGGGEGISGQGVRTRDDYVTKSETIAVDGGSVVPLLVCLCQEKDDWEVIRAAVAALSVAAYHEANADRMGLAAPDIIPVVVSLLSHADAEVQAHAATTLANLAHGSPNYQGHAGENGAIEALLNLCRGRVGRDIDTIGIAGIREDEGGSKEDNECMTDREHCDDNAACTVEGHDMSEIRRNENNIVADEADKESSCTTKCTSALLFTTGSDCGKEQKEGGENKREEGGLDTMDVDAIQAATAALANLLCYSDANSVRLVSAGGIGVLVGLISSYRPHNLLDFDQAEEIHANAAEALVNATRNYGEESAARVHAIGISPLVLMCGSDNLQVKRHAALVLGNVSQTEAHRAAAGEAGAVEALFALCDTEDGVTRANALWALSSLAWDPRNQERIGRFTLQLLFLASSKLLPVRTNALVCLGNALFFNEANRRRVEEAKGGLLEILGYCANEHSLPVQEAALRCIVSLTYVDRILLLLAEGGYIVPMLIAKLKSTMPASVRHAAALALLNVSLRDRFKPEVVLAGGVEALVALLGSDDQEERDLVAKILAALGSTDDDDSEAEATEGGKKENLAVPHLLGILQMEGNLTAQKAAAQQLAKEIWTDKNKQRDVGEKGGMEILLEMCDPTNKTESTLLEPVTWSLRNCLHNSTANQNHLLRAGGVETLARLCHASRLAGEWSVAEGVLTALIAACQGNEKICRRLLRAGLDELIDAAEDNIKGTTPKITLSLGGAAATSVLNPAIKSPGNGRSAPSDATSRRGLGTNTELGLDQIDEIGVDGVLREGASALAQNIQREAMENCSALATSLLQTLGPFNYVVCGHCGARESGGTTCSRCGYGIEYDFGAKEEVPMLSLRRRKN